MLTLRVDTVAGPYTPEEVCVELQKTADRLGITLTTELNDVRCMVFPEGSADILYRQYMKFKDTKFRYATNKE